MLHSAMQLLIQSRSCCHACLPHFEAVQIKKAGQCAGLMAAGQQRLQVGQACGSGVKSLYRMPPSLNLPRPSFKCMRTCRCDVLCCLHPFMLCWLCMSCSRSRAFARAVMADRILASYGQNTISVQSGVRTTSDSCETTYHHTLGP